MLPENIITDDTLHQLGEVFQCVSG
jgi:hypothetical protein